MTEAELRQVVVARIHLFDNPLEGIRGLLGIGDDRRDQVRNAFVGGELHALGIDEDHAHLIGRRAHEHRGDECIDATGLAGSRGSRDEQMGHLGKVGDDVASLDILAESNSHRMVLIGGHGRPEHVTEADQLTIGVGDLDANRTLARNRTEDAHLGARHRVRDVATQGRDPLDLDARPELDLVAGDGRTPGEARHARVDVELFEHLRERCDDRVICLRAGAGRRPALEHAGPGQSIVDCAIEGQLLGRPCRGRRGGGIGGDSRRRRRRLEVHDGDLAGQIARGGVEASGIGDLPSRTGDAEGRLRRLGSRDEEFLLRVHVDGELTDLDAVVVRRDDEAIDLVRGVGVQEVVVRSRSRSGSQDVTAHLAHGVRHGHEGCRGEDEQAEDRKQGKEYAGHDGAERCRDRRGRHPAGDASPGGQRVEAVARGRRALHEMPQTCCGEQKCQSTDDEPAVGDVILRIAQCPPADDQQQDRHGDVEGAEEVRRHGAKTRGEPAIDAEPHGGGDDDGESDEEQAQAIATMHVVEIAGAVPDPACSASDGVGDTQPQGRQGATDRGEPPGQGAWPAAGRTSGGRLAGRGGSSRGGPGRG